MGRGHRHRGTFEETETANSNRESGQREEEGERGS
jgi:hypothetical protein